MANKDPRRAVNIAVVTALRQEMPAALRPQRHNPSIAITPYNVGGRDISVASIVTGVGKVSAAAGMSALLHRMNPAVILCGGIAGSLNDGLPAGTVTIAQSCRYWDRDATSEGLPLGVVEPSGVELYFPAGNGGQSERLAMILEAPMVRIATGDSVVTAELLDTLPPAWRLCLIRDSDLVDMESTAWVETARLLGYEPVVCRTVFDMVLTGERALSFREGCRRAAEALELAVPLVLSLPD